MSLRSRNENYYIEAFEKLEKEGKHTWNWAAALFPEVWMSYRRMYACCGGVFLLAAAEGIIILAAVLEAIMAKSVTLPFVLTLGGIVLIFRLLLMAACGIYGNSLYYRTVRFKIMEGYHLSEKFQPTSLPLLLWNFAGFIACEPLVLAACFIDYYQNPFKDKKERFDVTPEAIKQYLQKKTEKGTGEKVLTAVHYGVIFVFWMASSILNSRLRSLALDFKNSIEKCHVENCNTVGDVIDQYIDVNFGQDFKCLEYLKQSVR